MGRTLEFIRLDKEKIQTRLGLLIQDSFSIKEILNRRIEHSNQAESYTIDAEELIAKIGQDPDLINPQEIGLLYDWIKNDMIYPLYSSYKPGAVEKEVESYGFESIYLFGGRATAEITIQELWNFFDPFDQRTFFSTDYIYSQKACFDFASNLCTLAAVFDANNPDNVDGKQYLAENTEYLPRALARYNFETQKQKCIEPDRDLLELYAQHEKIFDIIGYSEVLGDYFHLSHAFHMFLELRKKVSLVKPVARIYLKDSP